MLLIAEDAGVYKTADMIAKDVREIMDFERHLAKVSSFLYFTIQLFTAVNNTELLF